MAVVAELVTKFTGDTGGLQTAVSRATTLVKGFIGLEVANQLGQFALSTARWADDLKDLAELVGISTTKLQEMHYAALENGGSIEGVNSAIVKFNTVIGDAYVNGGALAKRMQELGIQGLDAHGNLLPMTDLLPRVADAIQAATTQQERLSIATDFFGRSAAPDMVRMLSNGSAGLAEFEARAHDAGTVMSEELITRAADINGKFEVLSQTISVNLKSALLGIVDDVMKMIPLFTDLGSQIDMIINRSNRSGMQSRFSELSEQAAQAQRAIDGMLKTDIGIDQIDEQFAKLNAAKKEMEELRKAAFEPPKQTAQAEVKKNEGAFIPAKEVAEQAKKSVEEARFEVEKWDDSLQNFIAHNKELSDDLKSSMGDLIRNIGQGKSAFESLKSVAMNALGSIAESLMSVAMGGSAGGGIGGALAGALTNALGATVTAQSGPMAGQQVVPTFNVPSYAVGTNYVPRDMLANIHKGEMIVPAAQAESMRKGGGQSVNQVIQIQAGVAQTVQAEIRRMLPAIQAATLSGVANANRRGSFV